jgi:hypothetical protein
LAPGNKKAALHVQNGCSWKILGTLGCGDAQPTMPIHHGGNLRTVDETRFGTLTGDGVVASRAEVAPALLEVAREEEEKEAAILRCIAVGDYAGICDAEHDPCVGFATSSS